MSGADTAIKCGKWKRESVGVSAIPEPQFMTPPCVSCKVEGVLGVAMLDTGCSKSIVARRMLSRCHEVSSRATRVTTVDGSSVPVLGESVITVVVMGKCVKEVSMLVMEQLLPGVDVILGVDVMIRLDGIAFEVMDGELIPIREEEVAMVGVENELILPRVISDQDFEAVYDEGKWTVEWKWIGNAPSKCLSSVSCYNIPHSDREEFDAELQIWVNEGFLQDAGQATGSVVPLMAVRQETKGKVRPVLDFRKLNEYVQNHSASSDVCHEKLRRWRKLGDTIGVVDLKKAYLQVHVHQSLWQHQLVVWKGRRFFLTRLGFGLCSAPKIMTQIVQYALGMDARIAAATDNYIDDIVINTKMVTVDEVIAHLKLFGLEVKPPESVAQSALLGLKIREAVDGAFAWSRGNQLPMIGEETIKLRELFSVTGKLIGHYPVCRWLRVACSYIKRHCGSSKWEDVISTQAMGWLRETMARVIANDPVKGVWAVPASAAQVLVWCDASSIAMGCLLEVNNLVVEDGSWLRKKDDNAHINQSELEAVIHGINMAIAWHYDKFIICTDSASVFAWVQSILTESHRPRCSGFGAMLVKRRLFIIGELIQEYKLVVTIRLVKSAENRADELTRVTQGWLKTELVSACPVMIDNSELRQLHEQHHFGVRRSLYLARLAGLDVDRTNMEQVVQSCQRCASIDPSAPTYEHGTLAVETNWTRVAIDVTHFGDDLYMTCVDCGPGRFAVWRKIRRDDAQTAVAEMGQICREFGPPAEILCDNGPAYRAAAFVAFCMSWNIAIRYRCAYRPQGNGIVERHHRTIKRMAARTQGDPLLMVYYYNIAPLKKSDIATVPATQMFARQWRLRDMKEAENDKMEIVARFGVGDNVFVKPIDSRCTSVWSRGVVTAINSSTNVSVDAVPRHVNDLRKIPSDIAEEEQDDDVVRTPEDSGDETIPAIEIEPQRYGGRPQRVIRRPSDYDEYDMR